jgi:serine phosphatase RsbU (regulator of sigma subunit)
MYMGATPSTEHLLGASVRDLPLPGRTASVSVPLGDSQILLVATPVDRLEGRLLADLWWIVLLGGLAATAAAVLLLRRLDHTRARAVSLANDKVRQHAEQQQIAETLQRGLLPQRLDTAPGTELASRYWPAGSANLVGGDFYDAFRVDAERWTIVIGDVCGKGIGAAALTGLVRHTIRTAIRHIDAPVDVLHAVHEAMMEHDAATFCTVCLVTYEPARTATSGFLGELTVVLGGHPQPLLVRGEEVIPIGFPGTVVGLHEPQRMEASRLTILAGDTLVLYTDGLTDAPGDGAVSVEELSDLLRSTGATSVERIADMIRDCQRSRSPRGGEDDTAVLVVRFGVDVDAGEVTGESWPADVRASLTPR